jgi:DNA-binding GntR family transcriptional regulator
MEVSRLDPRPFYVQAADDLASKIESGQYGPEDKLPSELQVMQTYGISRLTARAVFAELRRRRLIVTIKARGSYVLPAPEQP